MNKQLRSARNKQLSKERNVETMMHFSLVMVKRLCYQDLVVKGIYNVTCNKSLAAKHRWPDVSWQNENMGQNKYTPLKGKINMLPFYFSTQHMFISILIRKKMETSVVTPHPLSFIITFVQKNAFL